MTKLIAHTRWLLGLIHSSVRNRQVKGQNVRPPGWRWQDSTRRAEDEASKKPPPKGRLPRSSREVIAVKLTSSRGQWYGLLRQKKGLFPMLIRFLDKLGF